MSFKALTLKDGSVMYYGSILAEGALNINCEFSAFYIPKGVTLTIFTDYEITDSIDYRQNNDNNYWATRIYQGNKLNFILKVPSNISEKVQLVTRRINLGFKAAGYDFGNVGASEPCNLNVNCPAGNGWDPEKNSVALIVAAGDELCSGTLIMNTCGSNIPYVLTADHCLDAGNVANWVFQYQTWSTDCNTNVGWIESVQFNGCQLRSSNDGTDFALLQMNTTPANNSGIFYSGWSRATIGIAEVTVLHHPRGDLMKIARDNNAPIAITDAGPISRAVWQSNLDIGIVQQGSSGSAYFNQDHRIIGQHLRRPDFGTLPECNITEILGGRFDQSWTGGGTNATRLSNWLDPLGSNIMNTNTTSIANLIAPISFGTLSVSGSSVICSGSTGSVTLNNNGSPLAFPVSWTSSNTSVATVSPTGNPATITYVSPGAVTITASIQACGVTKTSTKVVEIGAPNYSYEIVPQPISAYTTCHKLNTIYTFQAQPAGTDPNYWNGTYQWQLIQTSPTLAAYPVASTSYNANITFPESGAYLIRVRRTNGCGNSQWSEYEETYAGTDCGAEWQMTVSPNPASGKLNVSITSINSSKNTPKLRDQVVFKLFNLNNRQLTKQWKMNSQSRIYSLDITDVQKGVYALEVNYKNGKSVSKVIVQ